MVKSFEATVISSKEKKGILFKDQKGVLTKSIREREREKKKQSLFLSLTLTLMYRKGPEVLFTDKRPRKSYD